MLCKENIIIIGAAAKNTGKTEFACDLISRIAVKFPVYGLKISTVEIKNGKCDHCDGRKCGICTSLEGKFEIVEESKSDLESFGENDSAVKDTHRMLRAGADKVYWLKARKDCFAEGAEKLLSLFPDSACVVCESNSLREIVIPGVFIVIIRRDANEIKHSCKRVIEYADRIITFDGKAWDCRPDTITFADNKWSL